MKTVIVIISFILINRGSFNAQDKTVKDLSCKESFELIQKHKGDTNFVIVDLSPEKTYKDEHIENAIFFDVLPDKYEKWAKGLNKNKTYLLYCTVGKRSRIGFDKMKSMNFKYLYHLSGGLRIWKKEGYATSKTIEIALIEKTINNVLGWAINKDFKLFFNTISDDSNFVSVTPYRKVKIGVQAVKNDTAFWANPDFKAIKHEVKNLKISISSSGDVAWFYCVLDDINTIKGKPANWENVRWTGVLEKREGCWRVVQQHYSWPKE